MKSRKKILAGMVAMALGSGAYAATFEGRLACDQDPREAATSCMLFVPVTDTVGLPVYTQQISVTYLMEPRGAAAAGMESEAHASSDISASAPVIESSSSESPEQASLSNDSGEYPRNEMAEGKPSLSEDDRQVSASSSRGGLFGWLKSERSSSAPSTRDILVEESTPAVSEPEQVASSGSRRGIFSWLTGERGSRSLSEQSAATDSQSSHELVVSERSADTIGQPGPFASSRDILIEESSPAVSEQERVASSGSRLGIFSWLTGDRGSRSMSEPSAATESPSSEQLADSESSERPDQS